MTPYLPVHLPGIDADFEVPAPWLVPPASARRESPTSPVGVDSAGPVHPKQPSPRGVGSA
jgi:hypothetical protein